MKKKVIIGLFLILVGAQFFRPRLDNIGESTKDDFRILFNPPASILATVKGACYDCHSNQTKYPWYAQIQPIGSYLDRHIAAGKAELNFNDFGKYKGKRRRSKLLAIKDAVESGEMPLSSYKLLHPTANLSKQEKLQLFTWTKQTAGKSKP